MNKLIIDSSTRIIRCVTSDQSPTLLPNETTVDVPDGFIVPGKYKKIGVDGVTVSDASQAEIDAYDDILQPRRVKKRQLISTIDTMIADGTLPAKVRTFVSNLKDYLA